METTYDKKIFFWGGPVNGNYVLSWSVDVICDRDPEWKIYYWPVDGNYDGDWPPS
jgi:hypothetical protein